MRNNLLGSILLIAGTSIGAGMLALPATTGVYGFFPSMALFITCWVFMTFTAFLVLEVNLWVKPDSNIISMAKVTLGKSGELIAWFTYLFLLYSLLSAYTTGLGDIFSDFTKQALHINLPTFTGPLLFTGLFTLSLILGTSFIDKSNRVLMFGLIITYCVLASLTVKHIHPHLLLQTFPHGIYFVLPIVITAFGFHVVIPSLRVHLKDNVKRLRIAIFLGSLIPLIIYILWQLLILGIVPIFGPHSLHAVSKADHMNQSLANALQILLDNPWITWGFRAFAFFAITTSFLGVSLSLFDFISDGFNIRKTHIGRIATAILTLLPPLLFAVFYNKGFKLALSFAGIFVAILLGILPALMAMKGRKKFQSDYQVVGKNPALFITMFAFGFVILIETYNTAFPT